MNHAPVVGIDLGTTNSEIAAFLEGQVQILGSESGPMLPSCVGLAPDGSVIVGEAARNQLLLYPERTVRSIKRKMGTSETVSLGEQSFRPQEVSALILSELAGWGQRRLGTHVEKAVITVPAYFSDTQRQATREAGEMAGLEVLRILNEPTAASLAYGYGQSGRHTTLIYDLGGGTFDVSLVNVEGDITEVLSSHGNNRLGGDDFDQLILEHLLGLFEKQHGIDLRQGQAKAYARLRWAAEEAKKALSSEPYAPIREEALILVKGKPLHLEHELSRLDFEAMIRPMLDSTLESVSKALSDAGLRPAQLDAILLVGGSTRIPLVAQLLEQKTGLVPRQDVNPDLCVALGAGVLASRLAGHEVGQVLVDVSPYSFGPSHLGVRDGALYPYCYKSIIKRNTPLPVTRTESYMTAWDNQEEVEFEIFQGEDEDALKNILVGEFHVEGLRSKVGGNEVMCRMSLDLDGILQVTAIEKETGLSKQVTFHGALRRMSEDEIAASRRRLQELCGVEPDQDDEELEEEAAHSPLQQQALELVERARRVREHMHEEDAEEALQLQAHIESALDSAEAELARAMGQLEELLFFVESART